ncbi:MAG: acyl--CoA ligase [Actinobacteria bacterium]|nr:acyl--CoA ligase [Actinomycetota bacterium]MBU1942872.1 acyl--CoA ligase [Actinomycetota bacterium]MBU2687604.1 acyl--CoA ligase [Actinomycetota bacterium]
MSYLTKLKLIADPGLSMSNFWDKAAAVYGSGKVAYLEEPLDYAVMPRDQLCFPEVLLLVNRMGNALTKAGVCSGDRVVIAMGNRIELILLCYACFKIGAIAVPLNYMLKDTEISYIAGNCRARCLVTDRDVFDPNIKTRDAVPGVQIWIMAGPRTDNLEGFLSLDELLEEASDRLDPARLHRDATCAIFYTSGTTGYPKGAMMTSKNLLTTQRITAAVLPVTSADLGISGLPGAHLMGFCVALLSFMMGAPGYFMKYFHPQRTLEKIQELKATIFVGVPAMYSMMIAADSDDYDLSSIRLWASGADAMPVEQINRFMGYGGMFFEGYGQVETSPITALKLSFGRMRFEHGCVGIPVFPVRTRIWDEECRPVPKGEAGELVVRGPNITKGYWDDSERNEEAFAGGWFHTGDMARRGSYGLLYFVDRKKDVVKAGGYSVFSKEVEEEIRAHPKVDEAAVVGLPHPTKVEVVAAVVTPLPGEELNVEELGSWVREHIAAYKAPRYIEVRDQMPYGMTLKVLKRVLRDELTATVDVASL